MKLLVPYVGNLQPADVRLMRLTEFLGISCETLPLPRALESKIAGSETCFVVNPAVMKQWSGSDTLPASLAASLRARFPRLLVHAVQPDAFSSSVVSTLSDGCISSVVAATAACSYEVARTAADVCGPFAGLTFGSADPANDRVFSTKAGVRALISIDGRPFLAAIQRPGTEMFFIGAADVADLNAEADNSVPMEYFSTFVAQSIVLRAVFGDECWRPAHACACIVVDDPLLQRNYGFLNFEVLLRMMERHGFHTTLAFIPHNFRRSAPQVTRMFLDNPGRLSICFHGNDHTGAEFASKDRAVLNTMLQIAETRISAHRQTTGLDCNRVMVFPQGNFSAEAMEVLKLRNFHAAVNTVPHPTGQFLRLTIRELAQPAVLRYGAFPLFLRNSSRHTSSEDIAFNVFYGRPVLIGEHHDLFQDPAPLADVVSRVHAVAPGIRWTNVGTAVANSVLYRRADDGYHVRAYSASTEICNDTDSVQHYLIEWPHPDACASVEELKKDGTPAPFTTLDSGLRVSAELNPRGTHVFSIRRRNNERALKTLGAAWNVKAYARRRLSEIRDNYLSKTPRLLAAAQYLHKRSFKKSSVPVV
jgi:hypothetical protein